MRSANRVPVIALLTALTFAMATPRAPAATRYVKADAAGSNNGTSWTNAYRYLQDALTVAVAITGDGVVVGADIGPFENCLLDGACP